MGGVVKNDKKSKTSFMNTPLWTFNFKVINKGHFDISKTERIDKTFNIDFWGVCLDEMNTFVGLTLNNILI